MAERRPHGKASLDPSEYKYVLAGDNDQLFHEAGALLALGGMRLYAQQAEQSRAFMTYVHTLVAPHTPYQCTHCGAHLRYFVVWQHLPTGEHIVTGEQCAEERMALESRAALELSLAKKAAVTRRAQERLIAAAHAWIENNATLWERMLAARGDTFVDSMVHAVAQYGGLTERQRAALIDKVLPRVEAWMQSGAICELRTPEPEVEAPEGRVELTGELVSARTVQTDFGPTRKGLVKDDRGFRVWITIGGRGDFRYAQPGDRVQVTATLQRSKDDAAFAFGSRPTKGKVLAKETA